MIKKGSLYCASDKAFFDALCQHKMSKVALQELFWTRGIIKSDKLEKEDIARYFSRLNHDYYDHKFISEKVSTGNSKEKQNSVYSTQKIKITDIENSVKELINERNQIENSIDYVTHEKSMEINLTYSYYDHKQTEFKQLVTKSAVISIEASEEGFCIRAPDNEYVSEICSSLLSKLTNILEEEHGIDTINLYGIDNIELKNKFFEKLISNLEGMELKDVSDVSVFNPQTGDEEESVGVHIKRASLNGEGVLNSGELKQFSRKGFFVYKISWSMSEKNNSSSHIYHFQAQFNDPEICKKFSYVVRGIRRYAKGDKHTKTLSPISSFEEIQMLKKLEKSAREAKKSVFSTSQS